MSGSSIPMPIVGDAAKTPISILAVLGKPAEYGSIIEWIRRRGQTLNLVMSGHDGIRVFQDSGADLVLVGLPLPDQQASALIGSLRQHDRRVAIVVVGSDGDVRSAVDALELGAHDYVASPIDGKQDLMFALGLALGVRTGDSQLRFLRNKDASGAVWSAVVGAAPPMRTIVATLRQVCERTAGGAVPIVLLTGETGTGKGLIAKSIHYNSGRRNRTFVDINCAAISPNLLESELFGHEKGAFTDARSSRAGLFETADKGSLFLDEVGAMPLELQGKLLTAIEDKRIRRVGGNHSMVIDVQIIAATHSDLAAMVKRNQFRADLYHRLNVIAIELPPLRDRGDDVITIAENLIAMFSAQHGMEPRRIADDAKVAMRRYGWPGNVRELRNELERIVLLVDDDEIRAGHFRFTHSLRASHAAIEYDPDAGLQITLTGDRCPLDELERSVIRQALVRCRGNVSRAARYLDVSRQTLVYRLKKFGFQTSTNPDLVPEGDDE